MKKLCSLILLFYVLATSCTKETYGPVVVKEVKVVPEEVECQGANLTIEEILLK
ncbi:MAG: hypothetical protein ABIR66_05660 [Saprospiraceae bacterium]